MNTAQEKAPTQQRQGLGVNHLEAIHMGNTNAISKENNAQLGTVEFLGKPLTVITTDTQLLVAMRPICEGIGLSWQSQYNRIQRDEVLSTSVVVMNTQMPGDDQSRQITCLPLNMLNGWLFGVDSKRCKPFVRQSLVRYKFECYDALAAYWQKPTPAPACRAELRGSTKSYQIYGYGMKALRVVPLKGDWLICLDDMVRIWTESGGESRVQHNIGVAVDRVYRGDLVEMNLDGEVVLLLPTGPMYSLMERTLHLSAAREKLFNWYRNDFLPTLREVHGSKPVLEGLDDKTSTCLHAVRIAMKTILDEHRSLGPVLQATGSRHLYGVEGALEVFQHAERYLSERFGGALLGAAEHYGFGEDTPPNVIGFKVADALGYSPLMPVLSTDSPERPALVGQLVEAEGELSALERATLRELQDVRLMTYYDEGRQLRVKAMDKSALVCRADQIPDLIRDPGAIPSQLLAPLLDAVAERVKRAA